MVLLLGVGFAIYWSSSLALLQEVIPPQHLIGANAAVLIAVQGGMLAAGGLVGLVYERAGLAGILSIDGTTYAISALCFYLLRRGYFAPRGSASRALFGTAGLRAQNSVDPAAEPEPERPRGYSRRAELSPQPARRAGPWFDLRLHDGRGNQRQCARSGAGQ